MLSDDQLKALEPVDIDLSGVESNTMSNGFDTITITGSGSDFSSFGTTITLPTPTYSYNSMGTTVGGIINGSGSSWNAITSIGNNVPNVNIDSSGIDIKDGADIKIGDRSLKEFMTKMEQRLAILVPDPDKLEKFEALKKAYEHYKTMESLCFDEPIEEEPK
jgi:hypothetical protein